MASLQGLPPLPKSLSGLLNFSSAQWKELERLHAMRTMIQQDLSSGHSTLFAQNGAGDGEGGGTSTHSTKKKVSLDAQLALLRKEMVGLRQLDMSLLCQLWSLNESIQEYKQMIHERLAWDNGLELSGDGKSPSPGARYDHVVLSCASRDLNAVPESLSLSSSSSQSSLEFGDL